MSYVASTITLFTGFLETITLSPDGAAYFHQNLTTSAIPPRGTTTERWGKYYLEGSTAVITWTQIKIEDYEGWAVVDDDDENNVKYDSGAPAQRGGCERQECNEEQRADLLPSGAQVQDEQAKRDALPLSKAEASN